MADVAVSETKNVKIEMGSAPSGGLQTHAKLAHALSAVVSGVIALAVAAVLADGTSVIKLKSASELPIVTAPDLKPQGLSMRLDQLLGPTYGIGLHHDQSGRTWTEAGAGDTLQTLVDQLGMPVVIGAVPRVIMDDSLKHPVHFLSCDELQKAGLSAMGLGFIAEVVAIVMLVFHSLALTGLLPAKLTKPLASLIWLVLTAGFLIVVNLAIGIYTATWKCNNPVVPQIKLSEHFDYNYGFGFAIVGFISAVLVFVVQLTFTATTDGVSESKPAPVKAACGVVTGLLLGIAISLIVGATENAYASNDVDINAISNPCEGKRPWSSGPSDKYFHDTKCMEDNVVAVLEQAAANVTRGFVGGLDAKNRVPITTRYAEQGLCPVNVHWHLGAEHLSVGASGYDSAGKGPSGPHHSRELAANARRGHRCHHYDSADAKFTTEYAWQSCVDMKVGETYEIHWPHSAAGQCGNKWQMQSPFYDGVFCKDGIISIAPLNTYEKIGVEGQVFTIVNSDDPAYQYDELFKGMWADGDQKGTDMAYYTGSTTGTSRNAATICSRYTPITWQVDRKCHMISAKSFDKLCADMLKNPDDMSSDVYAHGSRETVAAHVTANNQQTRK